MAEGSDKKTPRDLLRVVFRRRRLFLIGASLFSIAALSGAHFFPPVKFTGETIFERRSDVAAGRTLERGSESFETIKLTLQHELAGRDAVERVAEQVGLMKGLAHDLQGQLTRAGEMAKQEIVSELMKDIKVTWKVRSVNKDLISVAVTHRDPKLAQHIPNILVKSYINQISEQIIDRLTASRDFLSKQVGGCEGRLTKQTNERIKFETKHAGMMPESPGALQERIEQITSDIEARRRQQRTAKQTLARLKALRQATTAPATGPATTAPTTATSQPIRVVLGPNPELNRLKSQLLDYEQQLDTALTFRHMSERHPTVKTLRQKIAQLKQQIRETPEEVVLQKHFGTGRDGESFVAQAAAAAAAAAAESDLETTTRDIERLQKRLEGDLALMANFAPNRWEWEQIVDKIQKEEAELKRWQSRLTGVEMDLAAEAAKRRTHLNAVQAAQEQIRPSSPSLWIVLGFALVGGLGFGGGLVFLANAMDRSVRAPQDVSEYFDVPVHGVISEIVARRQCISRWLRRWTLGTIATVAILAGLSISGLSIVLWLRYPDDYRAWRDAPVEFVVRAAEDLVGGVFQLLS